MKTITLYVGLDVHKDSITIAIAEPGPKGEIRIFGTITNDLHALEKALQRIRKAHPGVLAVTGPHQYEAVVSAVHEALPPPHDPFQDLVPPEGLHLTPRHYAYLRMSEGCNQGCTFCTIPSIRGMMRSKPIEQVLAEHGRDDFVTGWLRAREVAWATDLIPHLAELEASK